MTHDVAADLTLHGRAGAAPNATTALGTATLGGGVSGGTWTLTGGIGSVTCTGADYVCKNSKGEANGDTCCEVPELGWRP